MNRHAITCGACGEMIEVELMSKPATMNLQTVSVVVVEHQGPLNCPACNTRVVPVMASIQSAWIATPVAPAEQNLIALPGGKIKI